MIPDLNKEVTALQSRIARELKGLSYEQLQEWLAGLPPPDRDGWRELPSEEIAGKTIFVQLLAGCWGLIRRRISVEVTFWGDEGASVPRVYLL